MTPPEAVGAAVAGIAEARHLELCQGFALRPLTDTLHDHGPLGAQPFPDLRKPTARLVECITGRPGGLPGGRSAAKARGHRVPHLRCHLHVYACALPHLVATVLLARLDRTG